MVERVVQVSEFQIDDAWAIVIVGASKYFGRVLTKKDLPVSPKEEADALTGLDEEESDYVTLCPAYNVVTAARVSPNGKDYSVTVSLSPLEYLLSPEAALTAPADGMISFANLGDIDRKHYKGLVMAAEKLRQDWRLARSGLAVA